MHLRNVNGTAWRTCGCGSLLAHWKKSSGQSLPDLCPTVGCLGRPTKGALVQNGGPDSGWYIIPLCSVCSKRQGESLFVSSDVCLVPANGGEACG